MKEKKKIAKVLVITIITVLLLVGCFMKKTSKKEVLYNLTFMDLSDTTNAEETENWYNKLLFANYEALEKIVADVNQDGIINKTDYTILYNYLMKCSVDLPERIDNFKSGDVDFDGKVDMIDAYLIKSFYEEPTE